MPLMGLTRRSTGLRSCVAIAMLVLYGVALLGVVPSPAKLLGWIGSRSQERYPCEDDGCGCASASDCWSHCCCFTEHERLVWAITNGVLPPEAVRFSDAQWIAAANELDPDGGACALCVQAIQVKLRQGIATHARHAHEREPREIATCQLDGHHEPCPTGASCVRAAQGLCHTRKGSSSGPAMSALSCKGIAQLLLTTLPPAPSSEAERMIVLAACSHGVAARTDESWTSRTLDSATPPPRSGNMLT